MTRPTGDAPHAADQIAGLTFAFLLVDDALVVREANPAAEDLLGMSVRRLVERDLRSIVRFDDPALAQRIAAPDARLTARAISVRVGERELVVNLTASCLPAATAWRVITLSDAGQEERLADEGRAAPLRGPAILAHEIKNPLAAIRGAAQLLARKTTKADQDLTALIADEVDRIAALIDRMQRLGREHPEPVGPLNLHAVVRRACETVFAGQAQGSVLKEEFDPSLPPVLGNEGALVQVFVNLLSNARDACAGSDDPQITVRTRFVSGLVLSAIRLGRPVKLPIEIQVSDNGPGVDRALADHIFEPFVTSKANGQGLGLALVRKLVRDMNGRITYERDEGAGLTMFRIHLPMAHDERTPA